MSRFASIMQVTATKLLRDLGTRCTVINSAGKKKTGYGVIIRAESKDDINQTSSGFITPNNKICYLQGNIGLTPEVGDTIKFSINVYTIVTVMDITPDDVSKHTIIYKLGVSA